MDQRACERPGDPICGPCRLKAGGHPVMSRRLWLGSCCRPTLPRLVSGARWRGAPCRAERGRAPVRSPARKVRGLYCSAYCSTSDWRYFQNATWRRARVAGDGRRCVRERHACGIAHNRCSGVRGVRDPKSGCNVELLTWNFSMLIKSSSSHASYALMGARGTARARPQGRVLGADAM